MIETTCEGRSRFDGESPLIAVMGPTASGKSAFAVKLAHALGGEIISADSAQVYHDLSIITARIKVDEMEGIPHHLIGFIDMNTEFSVADYQELAYRVIRDILQRNAVPILTGGTHLYIKAVAEGYDLPEVPPDASFREQLMQCIRDTGSEDLYRQLKERDPEAAERIHPHNLPRVIRALEVMEKTGRKFSDFYRKRIPHPLRINPFYIWIDIPRDVLYHRIDIRAEKMIEEGALDEVRFLIEAGHRETLELRKILGTRELCNIIEGKYSLKEGIEVLKRNTKKYAKRQITWLNSFSDVVRVPGDPDMYQDSIKQIQECLHRRFPHVCWELRDR